MNQTGTQVLRTGRLILRPYTVDDAEEMYQNWASDPEVTRFLTWPTHSDAGVTRMVLNDWVPRYNDGGYFNWAIVLAASGAVIGNIAVVQLRPDIEAADIGYCLSRQHWGSGIMPEALQAVIDYLFGTAGLRRITACHDIANPKSGRVMEKAGMRREGIFRQAGRNNTGICDVAFYAVLRDDWQKRRDRQPAPVTVRIARDADLESVNILRKQVNDLHVAGKPEVFKPGFSDELRNFVRVIQDDPEQDIAVAEADGRICGFAVLHHIRKPENPFMYERDFLDIDEFCVDEAWRRRGVASALVGFTRDYAREKGIRRIELNMWEFNQDALAFYEAAGFRTFRRYMELFLD